MEADDGVAVVVEAFVEGGLLVLEVSVEEELEVEFWVGGEEVEGGAVEGGAVVGRGLLQRVVLQHEPVKGNVGMQSAFWHL